jgi:hypothetical protein
VCVYFIYKTSIAHRVYTNGTQSGAVGGGTALQVGRNAGSIPDGIIGFFFHLHNHSGRLGLTQPLTEITTRNIT